MIPKKIMYNYKVYNFIKAYPNILLYEEEKTGLKECFNKSDLGLVKEQVKITRKPCIKGKNGVKVY